MSGQDIPRDDGGSLALARPNFDVAALRSLVAGVDLGSFAKAAGRVARSSSAVSAQIRKLEEQAGTPLFVKAGRGLALTDAGDAMLRYARRMIELNDEAAAAVRGMNLDGWVRVGLQEDFGEAILPDVLGRFARAHPKVRIEARVARNADLLDRLDANQLDLALVWGDRRRRRWWRARGSIAKRSRRCRCSGSGRRAWPRAASVCRAAVRKRVSTAARSKRATVRCGARRAAAARRVRPAVPVLRRGDRRARSRGRAVARCVHDTESRRAMGAAAAGLGLTVRSQYGLPASVRVLDAASCGLPALPSLPLILLRRTSSATPTVDRLARIVKQAVRDATEGRG